MCGLGTLLPYDLILALSACQPSRLLTGRAATSRNRFNMLQCSYDNCHGKHTVNLFTGQQHMLRRTILYLSVDDAVGQID